MALNGKTPKKALGIWLRKHANEYGLTGKDGNPNELPSNRDAAVAKAVKLRDFPSLDQVRAAIALMPIDTVVGRRNRVLMALVILTGIRDSALVSLSLRHVDLSKAPPLVRQEPDRVETILHRFFSGARLDMEIKDRFGNSVKPREWFLVPCP